jgi:signal transduction histidine kinase
MPPESTRRVFAVAIVLSLLLAAGLATAQTEPLPAPVAEQPVITNLLQLTRISISERRALCDVQLDAVVCAASRPKVGVIIVRDDSGTELLEVGDFTQEIKPGDIIHLHHPNTFLRKQALGVQLSAAPVVDNDRIHTRKTGSGDLMLKRGRIPVRLEWFNCFRDSALEVSYLSPGGLLQQIPDSALSHEVVDGAGKTHSVPGLEAECYEGYWESLPDFDLLRPVKIGTATNFDLGLNTRSENTAMRFTGYFDAPFDGVYTFRVRSDDGTLLYLRNWQVVFQRTGAAKVPVAEAAVIGEPVESFDERHWMALEGRVNFISRKGEGVEFELHSERDSIWVHVADAKGIDPLNLLNSYVRVTGVGQGVLGADKRIVLGQIMVASAKELTVLENAYRTGELPSPLTTARQVQGLPIEGAKRELPVRLRGVVTSFSPYYDHWMSIQDETRGIFVSLKTISNSFPAIGESWEVVGHTAAGDFAPVIVADQIGYVGAGRLPEPERPTWNQLINGSMDVQWVEFQGLVTDVRSNTFSLILPDGGLNVQMEGYQESDLKPYQKTGVRIRGALYAVWDANTREVRVGNVLMRGATIDVDQVAPSDPFDAPVKKPRDLFLFDVQATPFQRVKVLGEIIHAEPTRIFLIQDGIGIRVVPVQTGEFQAGDRVEAVGYPEISGPSPVLHEAVIRKIGHSPLPLAREVADADLMMEGLDASRVRVEGRLVGMHQEQNVTVLEMQSKTHLFMARLAHVRDLPLRIGSQLALTGVYAGQGKERRPGQQNDSFELLLNARSDIAILAEPSWWTLQRLLTVVGLLLVTLALAAVWITLLRRQVAQRTLQLQQEIRERERIERDHALEAERARIARDLHDDLGSSLTEISVLASTGRHSATESGRGLFRAIADKAHGLISALDVIVWAVDPEDNSLQSLADYLASFVSEYLSNSGISCRFKIPVSVPPVMLEGRVRHDLLLAVKETLNNIVRHSGASEVEFRLATTEDVLEIVVVDNGTGFDTGTVKAGHGLENLSSRLKKLGGAYEVTSHTGTGTTVKILLPLSEKVELPP